MLLNNALLLLLLALAVAAGWTLGRNGLRMDLAGRAQLPSQYYRGFNFLLDGEEDPGFDEFILVIKERNFINNMRTVYRESEDQLPGIDTTNQ